jgi:transposase-like protein
MKLYPLTVIEFQDAFPTDEACFEYLWLIKWESGFVCTSCGHDAAWKIVARKAARCKKCQKQISITAGTILQDRHISLRLLFQAIWYVVSNKNGVSALGLQSVLGLGSYRTAWTWLHKLRRAMVRPGRDKLSGVVEIDETLVGGSGSGKRGRGAEKKELVLVAVEDTDEKGLGRVRLKHIPDASAKTLKVAITEMVETGSTIRTDGWKSYLWLEKAGYNHVILSHSEAEPGIDPTPKVHRVASLLKRWLLGTHQGGQQISHLKYYLDEYTFRFNRRKSHSRGKLFYRLIQQALQIDHVPAAALKTANLAL